MVTFPEQLAMSQTRPKHPASGGMVASWRVMPPASPNGWNPPPSMLVGSPGVCVHPGFGSQTLSHGEEGSDSTWMPLVVSATLGSDLVSMWVATHGPQVPAAQVESPTEHVT